LLITEAIPSYFIFMEVDPKIIDVNIHPTKTEIKFEDEKAIYLLLKSAVKMAIGQNNISPSLDFETETSFSNIPPLKPFEVPKPPKIQYNPNYNPFTNEQNKKTETKSTFYQPFNLTKHNNLAGWESLYEIANNSSSSATVHTKDIENEQEEKLFSENAATPDETRNFMQWQNKYIVTGTRSGLYIIDQHLAHKRVLFEYYINKIGNQVLSSQQLLFPFNITLSPAEYALVSNHLKTFEQIGFVLTPFGGTTFNVTGIPFDITDAKAEQLIYQIINELKENNSDLNNKITQLMVACLSNVLAIKAGQPLHNDEIIKLIGDLFACSNPYTTPDGEKIMITLTYEEFIKRLNA
jgi:DNA mismatch repair protein MutL